MLLQASLCEDFGVVLDRVGVVIKAIGVDWSGLLVWAVALYAVRAQQDTLAPEVGKDVVCANKLETPVQGVQDVNLHVHELIVVERRLYVLK